MSANCPMLAGALCDDAREGEACCLHGNVTVVAQAAAASEPFDATYLAVCPTDGDSCDCDPDDFCEPTWEDVNEGEATNIPIVVDIKEALSTEDLFTELSQRLYEEAYPNPALTDNDMEAVWNIVKGAQHFYKTVA